MIARLSGKIVASKPDEVVLDSPLANVLALPAGVLAVAVLLRRFSTPRPAS